MCPVDFRVSLCSIVLRRCLDTQGLVPGIAVSPALAGGLLEMFHPRTAPLQSIAGPKWCYLQEAGFSSIMIKAQLLK